MFLANLIPLYVVLGLLVILVLILLIRTFTFIDKTDYYKKGEKLSEEKDDVVNKLGELIKCKTVSHTDYSLTDFNEYKKLIEKCKEMWPTVFEKCEFTETEDYALMFKLKGLSSEKPTVLMAHYDVVPVTEGWDHDPFLGEVVDGYLYGRGAIDTKCTMACALSALEIALKEGYIPKNDLYLTFGSNEEICDDAQYKIVMKLKEEGVKPALVFDEGGGILKNAFPGVNSDVAFLGMIEKGALNITLSIDGNGGHSSTPKKNGPVIKLSKALVKLEKNPMKPKFIPTTLELLNVMGKNASFGLKLIFANLWLFKPLVKKLFTMVSADTRALLTSTFAFTTLNGGNQINVIPNHVEAGINCRLSSFDTVDDVINHIKKVINDPDIKISYVNQNKMYPECSFKTEGYDIIKETVIETYNGTVVAPFVMLGGTDARHYCEISDCVIRFTPMKLTNEDRKGVHGLNEKVKVETLEKCLEFYRRLLQKI